MKRTPFKKKPKKATGEKALFEEIWEERERVDFITGEPIMEATVQNFAHVLSKGAYPQHRLNKENIVLLTAENHHKQHSLGLTRLVEMDKRWSKFVELQERLKASS
jgi:hypothetical protein